MAVCSPFGTAAAAATAAGNGTGAGAGERAGEGATSESVLRRTYEGAEAGAVAANGSGEVRPTLCRSGGRNGSARAERLGCGCSGDLVACEGEGGTAGGLGRRPGSAKVGHRTQS